jgi:hypothetical protein
VLRNCNGLIVTHALRSYRGDHYSEVIKKMSVRRSSRRDLINRRTSMRLLYSLAAAMLVTALLPVLHASAFSTDPTSGTNPDGSPRFVDPDDQIRSFFFGGSGVNEDGWSDRNSAPRTAFPSPDGTNQGITFPSWFFPTSPRR